MTDDEFHRRLFATPKRGQAELAEALGAVETVPGLAPIVVRHYDPRPSPEPRWDDTEEPGWRGPSYEIDASLIFGEERP